MGKQHEALFAAKLAGSSGGGGGGTSDYTQLTNKPQINGVTLTGNKSTADLDIVEPWVGTAAEYAQQSASIPAGTPYIITDDDYTAPCYFDSTTGELYVNGVKILAVMDEASYEALETKSNIWYATYPTPTPSLLMGGAKSSGNEEEPDEEEPDEKEIGELKEQDEKEIGELKEPETETKKNTETEISDEQLEKLQPFDFRGYDE